MKQISMKEYEQLEKELGQLATTIQLTNVLSPNSKNERAMELVALIQKDLHFIKPMEVNDE